MRRVVDEVVHAGDVETDRSDFGDHFGLIRGVECSPFIKLTLAGVSFGNPFRVSFELHHQLFRGYLFATSYRVFTTIDQDHAAGSKLSFPKGFVPLA